MKSWLLDHLALWSGKIGRDRQRRRYARLAVKERRELKYLDRILEALNDNEKGLAEALIKYLVIEIWHSPDPSDRMYRFREYFLEHLYHLLSDCKTYESLHFILEKLIVHLRELQDKQYVLLAQQYCEHLDKLAQADSQHEIENAVSELREVLNDFGTPVFGIRGGRYAYDFYRRAQRFFERSAQRSPRYALDLRDYPGSYSPAIFERIHNLLDKLLIEENTLSASYMHRYWEKTIALESQRIHSLPIPEKIVVQEITKTIKAYDGGVDVVELAIEIPIDALAFDDSVDSMSYHYKDLTELRVRFTNTSGKPFKGAKLEVEPKFMCSDTVNLEEISGWSSKEIMLDPKGDYGEARLCLKLGLSGRDPQTWELAWKTHKRNYRIIPPNITRHFEEDKIDSIPTRDTLIEEMIRPIQSGANSTVRLLCGMPYVGKTTLLEKFRNRVKKEYPDYLVVNIDFRSLSSDDRPEIPPSRQRSFLIDVVEKLNCSEERKPRFIRKLSITEDEPLELFSDFLLDISIEHNLLVLMDGINSKMLKSSSFIKGFLDFRPDLTKMDNSLHFIISGAAELAADFRHISNYNLTSSISSSSVIIIDPLNEKEIKKVLEQPFRTHDSHNYESGLWYDDLAVKVIAHYTGGHPLLIGRISRTVVELVNDNKLSAPISGTAMYNLLYAPLETCGGPNRREKILQLRKILFEDAKLIWEKLSRDIQKDLRRVLNWEILNEVRFLQDLGLLRITSDGIPRMRIELLE